VRARAPGHRQGDSVDAGTNTGTQTRRQHGHWDRDTGHRQGDSTYRGTGTWDTDKMTAWTLGQGQGDSTDSGTRTRRQHRQWDKDTETAQTVGQGDGTQ